MAYNVNIFASFNAESLVDPQQQLQNYGNASFYLNTVPGNQTCTIEEHSAFQITQLSITSNGILDGNFFRTQGLDNINSSALGQGFSDVMKGNTLFTAEQADQIVRIELQKNARKKIQPAIEEGKKFLAENAKRPGVKQTASGLQYEIITMGIGAKPADTSVVKIHYEGTLINGTYFDGSRKRGEPLVYPLNKLIPGWVEGVQLMPVGSRFKLYIPYQLGYGEQGSGEAIPGGSTLIFDVELLEIVK